MATQARPPLRFLLALALCGFMFGPVGCGFCSSDEDPENAESDTDDKGDKKDDKKKGDKNKKAKKPSKNIKKPSANKKLPKKTSPIEDKLKKKQRTGMKTPGKTLNPLSKIPKKSELNKKGVGKNPKAMPNPLDQKSPPPGRLEDMKPPTPIPAKIDNQKGKTLDLAGTMTRADVKNSTGYRGILRPGPLVGIEPGLNYGVLRLKPNNRDKFGVALQVWREPNPGAQSRKFNDLLRQYPDSKRSREMGDSAFRANWGGLNYLVWLNRKSRFIAAISCSDDICKDEAATLSLAKAIAPKIKKQ